MFVQQVSVQVYMSPSDARVGGEVAEIEILALEGVPQMGNPTPEAREIDRWRDENPRAALWAASIMHGPGTWIVH